MSWREDLRYFAAELPKRHRNAFHTMSGTSFDAAVAALDARLPQLDRDTIVVELARLVTMVGDGHTGIRELFDDPKIGFGHYAIALYQFEDGLYVYAAAPRYAAIAGGRVTHIGGVAIDAALERLRPFVWRDNESGFRDRVPAYAVTPEVLRVAGLADADERTQLTVSLEGRSVTETLESEHGPRPRNLGRSLAVPEGWVAASLAAVEPLWLRATRDYYRLEYLPETKTLYVQYNEVANKDGEPVSAFAQRIATEATDPRVERLVLDLRWNTGGNNYLNRPLLLALIKSRVNARGKLFALIGRKTFSAAQNLVNDLEKYTEVVFVGEPTAEHVNFYADAARIVLPNSGIAIGASALWWQDLDSRDRRTATSPQVAAELTWDDYRRGHDPALAAALQWRPAPALPEEIDNALRAGDATRAAALAKAFVANRANRYVNVESSLNALGYQLLETNRLTDAIAVFEINADLYPSSVNVHDSLGEAHAKAGHTALALASYRKVLQLDPANTNAAEMVLRLEK